MYRKEAITEDEVEEIINEPIQRERATKLLNLLMTKPYKNFYVFIKVLKAADATHQQLGKQLESAAASKKSQLKVDHAACSIL